MIKYVILVLVMAFCIWQIVLLAKNIVEREKQKKEKAKQQEAEAVATTNVDKKDD